jgi:hypothetical protein
MHGAIMSDIFFRLFIGNTRRPPAGKSPAPYYNITTAREPQERQKGNRR